MSLSPLSPFLPLSVSSPISTPMCICPRSPSCSRYPIYIYIYSRVKSCTYLIHDRLRHHLPLLPSTFSIDGHHPCFRKSPYAPMLRHQILTIYYRGSSQKASIDRAEKLRSRKAETGRMVRLELRHDKRTHAIHEGTEEVYRGECLCR